MNVHNKLVLHDTRLERYKHSCLLGPFITYEKMKYCEYITRFLR